MGDVVLGYDGSRSTRMALDVAIEQARAFGDRLVVVFADEPPGRSAGEEFREHRRALDEIGEQALADAAERAKASGVEAETLLVPERPAVALEATARSHATRLIVVGTYGEGPFKSAILGSTPHKLLHFSEVPVLCVPSTGENP
ncbi:universal stress protein [Rubrobacter tropicus]|uniref:Universal stress protein n=1 Tax=Rubrobacter tropicus TaxID=2653851 RepID=A0A6G8QCB4_9ACTN|nr:universal stress protein [Rubrobacter tropicus]QIN84051.1 universal stress protein [Rubrobacter tropicus]